MSKELVLSFSSQGIKSCTKLLDKIDISSS
jgi:hypothetical protein